MLPRHGEIHFNVLARSKSSFSDFESLGLKEGIGDMLHYFGWRKI
jgi:hypothetical protein